MGEERCVGKWDSEIQDSGEGYQGDIAPRVFGQEGEQRNGSFPKTGVKTGHEGKAEGQTACFPHLKPRATAEASLVFPPHTLLKLNVFETKFYLFTTLIVVACKCLLGPRHHSNPYDMVLSGLTLKIETKETSVPEVH